MQYGTVGKVGNALEFISGTGVEVLPSVDFDNLTAITIEAWVYRNDTNYSKFIIKGDWNYEPWWIGGGGEVLWGALRNGPLSPTHVTAEGFTINAWHHVAMTYDSTVASPMLRLYMDGVEVASSPWNGAVYSSPYESVYIGIGFNGILDEVAVYKCALSSSEIEDHAGINAVPVADAGPDQTVEQEGSDGTEVTLDGSGSTDEDSTPGTNDDIVSFDWYEDSSLLGSGEQLQHTFQLGEHTITLVVTDSGGKTDEDEVTIVVEDTTSPTINSISANPDVLWPPNHRMVEVTFEVDAEDICDPEPICYILEVTSNEPVNGQGDGNTESDWEYTDDPLVVLLRAERSGCGDGRVYTVCVVCEDASGNTAYADVEVTVPHDKGKGKGKNK
ncbi:MAG: hypothetical protein JW837_06360 [Sedimentisphaerales bacterium]|nr:hypothetical protein [Sedimentisphaerales bacterium]